MELLKDPLLELVPANNIMNKEEYRNKLADSETHREIRIFSKK